MYMPLMERIMSNLDPDDLVREQRAIAGFDRVLLRGYGDLEIVSGPVPGLTITTHKTLIDRLESEVKDGRLTLGFASWRDKVGQAFTTSLDRKPISYRLTVARLAGLEIRGMARVRGDGIAGDGPGQGAFTIVVRGVAGVQLKGIQATSLAVHMAPGGKVALDGEVQEQRVTIKGPGTYAAAGLQSRSARINIQGPGQAAVSVEKQLSATIFGPGRITYHGAPAVQRRLIGPAVVRRAGDFEEVGR